jgi:uncharacterized protein (TIGR02147 family)
LTYHPLFGILLIEEKIMKPNIFEFTDYRQYIKAYYEAQKELNPHFSFQVFCNNAGFPNKGFVHNVIYGVKNLSRLSAMKFSQGMRLTKSEAEFFESLVFFNQAKNVKEKNHYFEKLSSVKPMTPEASIAKKVVDHQFSFYSTWYGSAIRSMIDMFPEKSDDFTWIGSNLHPRLSPVLVRKTVKTMLALGLLERINGRLKVKEKTITTGREAKNLAVAQFHMEMMRLAQRALADLPSEKRHMTGLTLGISHKAYLQICEDIFALQEKILRCAETDEGSDSVYQLNFQLFPLSKVPINKD